MLEIRQVAKSYGALRALRGVDLDVHEGRIVGLIGPNGSGKSTLFDIVSGFQKADGGRVRFSGEQIGRLPPHAIAKRGLMRTFQLSEGGQRLTVTENLLAAAADQIEADLASAVLRFARLRRVERRNLARASEILELLGLTGVADARVAEISGGQRKLVDLGRVLMARPALCLLDEPTAGVNPTLINTILDALKAMRERAGITLLIVEHNMRVVTEICDIVHVLDAGQLIASGTAASIQSDQRVLGSYLGHRPVALA